MKIDVNKVKEEALDELNKEAMAKAKRLYKDKLHQLADARQIVENLERELDDLTQRIEKGVY